MYPDLYSQFLQGDFVIKTNEGAFNPVAPDMKLEQSIMRSSKSAHGVIGQTRILDYITKWQLIYHETLEISSTLRKLTNTKLGGNDETRLPIPSAKQIMYQAEQ